MEVDFIGLDVGLKISGDSISRRKKKKKKREKKVFSTVKKKITHIFNFLSTASASALFSQPLRSCSPLWWFGLWTMVWFSSSSHFKFCSSPGRGVLTSVTLQVYLQRRRGSTVLQYNREHLENKRRKKIRFKLVNEETMNYG